MRAFFTLVLCSVSGMLFSQQISGTVTDEEGNVLAGVLVFNAASEKKAFTQQNGRFSIDALSGNELRFVRKGYERYSERVNAEDFLKDLKIRLTRSVMEIEEVKVVPKLTGNLAQDSKYGGDGKATQALKIETGKYIASKSSPEILAPKPGEFVQPVGPGFSVGKIESKWDDVDFLKFLTDNIDKEFFTEDLQLQESEIQRFVYYIFRNFERGDILKYGFCSAADVARFISECNKKVEAYRNHLPNDPPKKKRKEK